MVSKTIYAPIWNIFQPWEKLNQAHPGMYFVHDAQYMVCDSCDNWVVL